mgnify:CR=1 FL=1
MFGLFKSSGKGFLSRDHQQFFQLMYTKTFVSPAALNMPKDLMGGRPLHLAGRKKLVRHVAGDPDHFRECNDTDVKPSARSQEIGRFLDELRLIGESDGMRCTQL